jgi:hypothetical protein
MTAMRKMQIYLTREQRERLDALANRDDRSLAELVREAVDEDLEHSTVDPAGALSRTFGIAPDFDIPSRDEWGKGGSAGHGRLNR